MELEVSFKLSEVGLIRVERRNNKRKFDNFWYKIQKNEKKLSSFLSVRELRAVSGISLKEIIL